MSKHANLREEIKAETGKFKNLSFSAKLTYIRDYYWLHILIAVITVLVVIFGYKTYQAKNFNTVLYVALANNHKPVWEDEDPYVTALKMPYSEYLGIDNLKNRIIIDNNYTLNYEKDPEMSVYSSESLVAMMYGGKVDALIGDAMSLDHFCEGDYTYFYPLDNIFDAEFLEKYKDKVVYHTFTDGTKTPVALDITDCPYIVNADLTIEPVYISLFENPARMTTAADYIKYILESK